jgi:hypothetical protein
MESEKMIDDEDIAYGTARQEQLDAMSDEEFAKLVALAKSVEEKPEIEIEGVPA